MAGESIGKLSAIITADARGFDRAVQHVRRESEQLTHGIGQQWKQIGEFRLPSILPVAGGVAVAEIPMRMLEKTVELAKEGARWFLDLTKAMHELQITADRLHVGVVELQLMQVAAAGAGVDIQTVATALDRMQKRISEAVQGSAESVELFRELSLSPARLEAMGAPDQAAREIAMALKAIENPMERTRLEMELFGRSGARLRLFLDEMAGGMEEFRAIVADEAAVEQLAEIAHTIELVTLAIKGLAVQAAHFAIEGLKGLKQIPRIIKENIEGLHTAMERAAGVSPVTAFLFGVGSAAGARAARAVRTQMEWTNEAEKAGRISEAEAAERRFWDAFNDSLDRSIAEDEEWAGSYEKACQRIEEQIDKLKGGFSEAEAGARKFLKEAEQSGRFQPWQLDEMKRGLDILLQSLETEREYAEARKAAKAAVEHAATAEEKFRDVVQRAHDWRTMGIVDAGREAKIIRAAQRDLLAAWKSEERWEPAPLARRGSAEEYAIIARAVAAAQQNEAVTSRLDAIAQNTADTARAVERAKEEGGKIVSIPP